LNGNYFNTLRGIPLKPTNVCFDGGLKLGLYQCGDYEAVIALEKVNICEQVRTG